MTSTAPTLNELRFLESGLRVLSGAWGAFSPLLARVAETDEELSAAWSGLDEAMVALEDRLRQRMRGLRNGSNTP